MLNISKEPLIHKVEIDDFPSGKRVMERSHYKYFNRFLTGAAIFLFLCLFLPWTQNVTGNGFVTTLTPDQRAQTLQSPIPGKIEQWYVREGDSVQRGDTILRISEIKNEYMDPRLVERTSQQIGAKTLSSESYQFKAQTLNNQVAALQRERGFKLEQAKNKLKQAKFKVTQDSIGLVRANVDIGIAQTRLDREKQLLDLGINSPKEFEEKQLKFQETQEKLISQKNKLLGSENEVLNAKIELNTIEQSYQEKIAKVLSNRASAEASKADTDAQVSKLEVDLANYELRNDLYYVTAPQDGFINRAIIGGLGETFKEGQPLVNIMPLNYDLAVETFVAPIDLPLMHVGEEVRIQFDGWPAIVFSGWPNVSYGTYGAKVVAVETFVSDTDTGKYRILLAPDTKDHPWPSELRPGAGAYTIALLEDVPVWFELWRRLNGFPPNYYQPKEGKKDAKKK